MSLVFLGKTWLQHYLGSVSYTHLDVYKRQVQFTFVVVIGELFRIGVYGIEADEEVTAKAVEMCIRDSPSGTLSAEGV